MLIPFSSFVANELHEKRVVGDGVYFYNISITNGIAHLLTKIRNVFIQFWNFIRYQKWPLIEMYIFNQYRSFRNRKTTLKRIQSHRAQYVCAHSIWNLLYYAFIRFFCYWNLLKYVTLLSRRFGSFMLCGFRWIVCKHEYEYISVSL